MSLDTFFIVARPKNEASNDRILGLETSIAQILLFVNHIFKEEITISIKTINSFLVYNKLNVCETFVEIACATFVVTLSLTK